MNMKTPIQATDTQQVDPLPPEVVALCALLARILSRCIQEQDPQVLFRLGFTSAPAIQSSEVSHEHAA